MENLLKRGVAIFLIVLDTLMMYSTMYQRMFCLFYEELSNGYFMQSPKPNMFGL